MGSVAKDVFALSIWSMGAMHGTFIIALTAENETA